MNNFAMNTPREPICFQIRGGAFTGRSFAYVCPTCYENAQQGGRLDVKTLGPGMRKCPICWQLLDWNFLQDEVKGVHT